MVFDSRDRETSSDDMSKEAGVRQLVSVSDRGKLVSRGDTLPCEKARSEVHQRADVEEALLTNFYKKK